MTGLSRGRCPCMRGNMTTTGRLLLSALSASNTIVYFSIAVCPHAIRPITHLAQSQPIPGMGMAPSASQMTVQEWPWLAYQTALTFLGKADNRSPAPAAPSGLSEPRKTAEAFLEHCSLGLGGIASHGSHSLLSHVSLR